MDCWFLQLSISLKEAIAADQGALIAPITMKLYQSLKGRNCWQESSERFPAKKEGFEAAGAKGVNY